MGKVTLGFTVGLLAMLAMQARLQADLHAEMIPNMSESDGHSNGGAVRLNEGVFVWGGRDIPGFTSSAESYMPSPQPFDSQWVQALNFPSPVSGMAEFVLGNCAYSIGGEGATAGHFNQSVHAFDGSAWSTRADFPTKVWDAEAEVVGEAAYVFGGRRGYGRTYSNTYRYDSDADQWREVEGMERSVMHAATGSWNGRVFVFGGNHKPDEATNQYVRDIQVYDPILDEWEIIAPMVPETLAGINGVVFNEEYYLFADQVWDESSSAWIANENAYIYSFVEGTWTTEYFVPPVRAEYISEIVEINGWGYVTDTGVGSNAAFRVQLPEPGIAALLCLGGLMIRRRVRRVR